MKTKKVIALFLCAMMVIGCLAGCGDKGTTTTTTTSSTTTTTTPTTTTNSTTPTTTTTLPEASDVVNDTMVTCYCSDLFTTRDPYQATTAPDCIWACQVFETLYKYGPDSVVEPYLAESYTVNDDGTEYTIKIVEDAVFSDGTPLKASDVAFTYNYAMQNPSKASAYNMVESVEAVGDYEVKFTLNAPNPLFLSFSTVMPIMSEAFTNANDITKVTCGSGPYTLEEFDPSTHAVLKARDDYRLGAPQVKNAEIRYFADASSAQVAFESGEIYFMSLPTASAALFQDDSEYVVKPVAMNHTAIVELNTTVAPFDNKLVRQAFSYAADKQSIIQIAYDGYATEARIQATPSVFGVDFSKSEDISYNPEKAKELLAEAGYPNGLDLGDFGIKFQVIAGGYHEKIAQVYQQNLKDIGVTVELEATETPDENATNGDFAMLNEGISCKDDFAGNQNHYASSGLGGVNWSRINDPYIDEMFAKGLVAKTPEERQEIYADLIAYIIDQCPGVPMFHKQNLYAWHSDLNVGVVTNNINVPYYFFNMTWN